MSGEFVVPVHVQVLVATVTHAMLYALSQMLQGVVKLLYNNIVSYVNIFKSTALARTENVSLRLHVESISDHNVDA